MHYPLPPPPRLRVFRALNEFVPYGIQVHLRYVLHRRAYGTVMGTVVGVFSSTDQTETVVHISNLLTIDVSDKFRRVYSVQEHDAPSPSSPRAPTGQMLPSYACMVNVTLPRE